MKRVEIPKGDGKTRPLGIPAVKDRIVQTALKMVIEPVPRVRPQGGPRTSFEVQFRPCSYGFRPGRHCKGALREVDGLMERSGRRMVRYADDFVILCRTQAEAEAALREVQAWVAENGLTLHPDKTRIGDCRQAGQGFSLVRGGRRLVRRKSLKALRDKVGSRTARSRGDSLGRIIGDINPTLRGWFGCTRRRVCSAPSTAYCATQAGEAARLRTMQGRSPTLAQCLLRCACTVHPTNSPCIGETLR